jgi:hypothetical protein
MNRLWKHWYLCVIALIVNENLVQWALAIFVGHLSVIDGFRDAFKYFTLLGYLFFTVFRLIPYLGLAVVLNAIERSRLKDFTFPVQLGGIIGILSIILWGSWTAMRPLYTGQHVSSTTAIAFVFIPIYACFSGMVGAVAFAVIYTPMRILRSRQNKPPDLPL